MGLKWGIGEEDASIWLYENTKKACTIAEVSEVDGVVNVDGLRAQTDNDEDFPLSSEKAYLAFLFGNISLVTKIQTRLTIRMRRNRLCIEHRFKEDRGEKSVLGGDLPTSSTLETFPTQV